MKHGKKRTALFLARALSRVPHEPLRSPEGDAGGGGGGGTSSEKTFTQADLDRIVGQRIGEATKKFSDYETVKTQAQKAAEYETELAKLREEKEMQGKTAEEQNRIAADRAARAMERERSESATKLTAAEKRAEEAENRFRRAVISQNLGSALDSAKVLTSAREKAIRLMREDAQIELDDDGKIASITYNGIAFKTAAEAAHAFLRDNDFLASAPASSGGGTKPPNAGGNSSGGSLFDLPQDELLSRASGQK
jgi:hypothetical protein